MAGENVQVIAESLSKAQRRAVLGAEEIVRGELNVNCTDALWDELGYLGLVNWEADSLTPLGLAVRQYLQNQEPNNV